MGFRIFFAICLICGSTNTRAVSDKILTTITHKVTQLRTLFSSQDISEVGIVQTQLARMRALDQEVRQIVGCSMDKAGTQLLAEVDQFNTGQIKKILNRHTWVYISKFGVSADTDRWLLVQHADHDLDFQENCLRKLESLVESGETRAQNYAYLYDRVAVAESRPQRYGTQAKVVGERLELYPFEGETEDLEVRRREMGLSPLKIYLEQMRSALPLHK